MIPRWRLHLHLIPALLLVAFLVAAVSPAAAQMHGQDQIMEYMDRTEELIRWASDLVAETESGPARQVLRSAVDLHMRSRRSFEGGQSARALDISRRARDATYHSVRLAREAMGLEERIRMRADRFQDQHHQLMERAREVNHRQAEEILDRARLKADRAREQYRQGDFKLAWKMFEQAGDLQRRAARLLAETGGAERLDREFEVTADLIDRTGERLGPNADPKALDLLNQARETLGRANQAREQGNQGQALQLGDLARQLAHRAGSLGGLGPDEEAVRRQIERFEERLDRVSDQVRESGSDRARDFVNRAVDSRNRAEQHLRNGENEQALRRVRTAHDLLGQAEDLIR